MALLLPEGRLGGLGGGSADGVDTGHKALMPCVTAGGACANGLRTYSHHGFIPDTTYLT
jgi:hypothetical protein